MIAEYEDYPAEIIHTALAEWANLLMAAWKAYERNFLHDLVDTAPNPSLPSP